MAFALALLHQRKLRVTVGNHEQQLAARGSRRTQAEVLQLIAQLARVSQNQRAVWCHGTAPCSTQRPRPEDMRDRPT